MNLKVMALIPLLLLISVGGFAQSGKLETVQPNMARNFEKTKWISWQEALGANQDEFKKPILIFLSPPWCQPCEATLQAFDTHPALNEAAQEFSLVHINPEAQPEFWPYAVKGFPTVAICLPDGKPLFGLNAKQQLIQAAVNAGSNDYEGLASWLTWSRAKITQNPEEAQRTSIEALAAQGKSKMDIDPNDLQPKVEENLKVQRDLISGFYGYGAKRPTRADLEWLVTLALREKNHEDARFLLLTRYRVARLMGPNLDHFPVRESGTRDFRKSNPIIHPPASLDFLVGLAKTLPLFPDSNFELILKTQVQAMGTRFTLNQEAIALEHMAPLVPGEFGKDPNFYGADGYRFAKSLIEAGQILDLPETWQAGIQLGDDLWLAQGAGPLTHNIQKARKVDSKKYFIEPQLAAFEYWVIRAQSTGKNDDLKKAQNLLGVFDRYFDSGFRPLSKGSDIPEFSESWRTPSRLLARLSISLLRLSDLNGSEILERRSKSILKKISPSMVHFQSQDQALFLLAHHLHYSEKSKTQPVFVLPPENREGKKWLGLNSPPLTRVKWTEKPGSFTLAETTTDLASEEEIRKLLVNKWQELQPPKPWFTFLP